MLHDVLFILKNGAEITVRCEDCKIKTYSDIMTGYELNGIAKNRPLHINIGEIAAVIDKGPVDEIPEEAAE